MYRIPEHIQAVIFDLDGTLIDSTFVWQDVDADYLGAKNIAVPEDLQGQIEGMSFTEVAIYVKNRFSLSESVTEIVDRWHEMATDYYAHKIELKKGALDFIRWLKERGIKIGLATSNSRLLLELVLNRHGLMPYFDAISTSCEVKRSKPHPDVYLKVAQDLKVSPQHCLAFEDTLSGVMSAYGAHMQVIGVHDSFCFHPKDEIAKYTTCQIDNYDELK